MADHSNKENEKKDIKLVKMRSEFARREHKVQKAGLICLFVFLMAGLFGLFGGGFLSSKIISEAGYSISYQQYLRKNTPAKILIHFENPEDTTIISFPSNYLKKTKVSQIMPEPIASGSGNNHFYYTFSAEEKSIIVFYLVPEKSGREVLKISVNGNIHQLNQFIYY